MEKTMNIEFFKKYFKKVESRYNHIFELVDVVAIEGLDILISSNNRLLEITIGVISKTEAQVIIYQEENGKFKDHMTFDVNFSKFSNLHIFDNYIKWVLFSKIRNQKLSKI